MRTNLSILEDICIDCCENIEYCLLCEKCPITKLKYIIKENKNE